MVEGVPISMGLRKKADPGQWKKVDMRPRTQSEYFMWASCMRGAELESELRAKGNLTCSLESPFEVKQPRKALRHRGERLVKDDMVMGGSKR
jgi:hypothetical protein